jgi:hypothetical protein
MNSDAILGTRNLWPVLEQAYRKQLKYFFFKSNRGQLNTKHKENFGEFGALICFSPLIYSRLGYLLIHTI